jgi:proteasome assembly chaperone (PAC2) family protein
VKSKRQTTEVLEPCRVKSVVRPVTTSPFSLKGIGGVGVVGSLRMEKVVVIKNAAMMKRIYGEI